MKFIDKNLLVLTGFKCNNNCIICSVKNTEKKERSTEEIIKIMQKGSKEGYKEIEFTGGEPTIRPDIIELIKFAKKIGYKKISISTNGRLFSYKKVCEKFIETGLNRVTFSLLGESKFTHDAICRTPGSFDDTIKGIKNFIKLSNVTLSINTVISKLNTTKIIKILDIIHKQKIEYWNILDLIPEGNAKKNYKKLVVEPGKMGDTLNSVAQLSKVPMMTFFDFPFCFFSPKILNKKKINFINAKSRTESYDMVGYIEKRILKKGKIFNDFHKTRIDFCIKCKYKNGCAGIWHDYIKLFGLDRIKKAIIKINAK